MTDLKGIADGIKAIVNAVFYGWNRIRKSAYSVDMGLALIAGALAFEYLNFRTSTAAAIGLGIGVVSMCFNFLPDEDDHTH